MAVVTRAASRGALVAWLVGGALAAFDLATRTHVREFQSGAPSHLGERLSAFVQRTAVESVGFGATAALLALLGVVLARGDARRAWGVLWCGAGALWIWVRHGAVLAEEFVPFLGGAGLVGLNLVGVGAPLAALLVAAGLSKRLPFARGCDPAWTGAGAGLLGALASDGWRALLSATSSGLASPTSLGAIVAAAIALPLLAAPLGRLLRSIVGSPLSKIPSELVDAVEFRMALLLVGSTSILALALADGSTPPAEPSYPKLEGHRTGEGPRHVLLVVIDTLRADALGTYGYDRGTSPRIDALAAEGTVFDDVSSPAAWTKPSTASLLTGLFPSRHGALHHGSSLRTPEGLSTLAEAFSAAGFATAGFVSNPNVKKIFDFDRGFDEYFDAPVEDTVTNASIRESMFGRVLIATTRHQFNWKYANDVFQMNRHVEAWLRANADQDWFCYVHYIDPHSPTRRRRALAEGVRAVARLRRAQPAPQARRPRPLRRRGADDGRGLRRAA
ncbi:MAG: sulfatase-like hydrolase/transferase [Planctomycetota bacterium]